MAQIVCNINLGALKQDLYIKNQNTILNKLSLTLAEIPTFISKQKDIKDVYISGANKEFLEKIEYKTRKLEYSCYQQDTKFFHYI